MSLQYTSYANQVTIRDAMEQDVNACLQLDLSYETDYVWQMDVRDENGAIAMSLRTVRLPRSMRVVYPREAETLMVAWQKNSDPLAQHHGQKTDHFLVAESGGLVRAYLIMRIDPASSNAWISDIAVGQPWRRQKIGSALFLEAYERAHRQHARRLMVETQTKNYPGICFCQQHGLAFCGYNDRYYPNYDIALFFGQYVR